MSGNHSSLAACPWRADCYHLRTVCEVTLRQQNRFSLAGWLTILLVAFLLTACASSSSIQENTPTPEKTTAVPAYPGAYPAATVAVVTTPIAYPAPPYSNLPEGPQFTIDQPVRLSTGQVTGTGPAGVPIRIVNITRGAIDIATVTIGADGTFRAPLSETFVGDRIAIMLGDISGTGLDRNQFLRGPGYEDWPLIGILFASATVEE